MNIHAIQLGPLETNCYVVRPDSPNNAAWLIDVGMWSKPLVEYLRDNALQPSRILITHGHADHIGGIAYVKQHFPEAIVCAPAGEEDMLTSPEKNLSNTFLMGVTAPEAEESISPGRELSFNGDGSRPWTVLDTSGHTPAGLSFYCGEEGIVFTGDALFCRSIGRSDIPGGDHEKLVENIRNNLLSLPDDTTVYPGHGPPTTIGAERRDNPFLQ